MGSSELIAVFLPSLSLGGAELCCLRLAEGLSRAGCSVELWLGRGGGELWPRRPSAVRVRLLGKGRTLKALPALVSNLRRLRPRAMLTAMNHANLVAILAWMAAGVSTRLVISEHTALGFRYGPLGWRQRRGWLPWLARWLYPRAYATVAVSPEVAHDLVTRVKLPPQTIRVLANPVLPRNLDELKCQPVDHPWLASPSGPVLLGVGRLSAEKDFATAILALTELPEAVRLLILGEGPERPALEALAASLKLEDRVSLPGRVDNPFAYLSRAQLCLVPSRAEGLPGVLIEALACATPVVASDCPGASARLLGWGRYGQLFEVGNSVQLARAVTRSLQAPCPAPPAQHLAPYVCDQACAAYQDLLLGTGT